MKNLCFNLIILLVGVTFLGCQQDFPDPAMPDLSKVSSDEISAFNVLTPSSGTSLTVFQPNTNEITISWEATEAIDGSEVTYDWVADEADGDFSTPLLIIPSNNSGLDTELTLSIGDIDAALASIGVPIGTSSDLKWTIRATAGAEVRLASTPRLITIRRGGLTIEVYVPDNTPADKDVYLAGQFSFAVGANWQQPGTQPGLKMNKVNANKYTITIAPPADGATFEYKYFLATAASPDWSNGERKPTEGGDNNGSGIRNRRLTYIAGNDYISDVVSIWEQHPYDHVVLKTTVPSSTPLFPTKEVFVAGQWNLLGVAPDQWQQPGTNGRLEMTRDFDVEDAIVFFYVIPRPASDISAEYKHFLSLTTDPTWDNGESRGNRTFNYTAGTNLVENTVDGWDNL